MNVKSSDTGNFLLLWLLQFIQQASFGTGVSHNGCFWDYFIICTRNQLQNQNQFCLSSKSAVSNKGIFFEYVCFLILNINYNKLQSPYYLKDSNKITHIENTTEISSKYIKVARLQIELLQKSCAFLFFFFFFFFFEILRSPSLA